MKKIDLQILALVLFVVFMGATVSMPLWADTSNYITVLGIFSGTAFGSMVVMVIAGMWNNFVNWEARNYPKS